jgi:hypothetical protein
MFLIDSFRTCLHVGDALAKLNDFGLQVGDGLVTLGLLGPQNGDFGFQFGDMVAGIFAAARLCALARITCRT